MATSIRYLRKTEKLIQSCEHCNPEGAEIPFDAEYCPVGAIGGDGYVEWTKIKGETK
jgi:hypothetical protein